VFNPQPRIERVDVGGGFHAWVVDDALQDPHALRQRAITERQRFEAAPYNAYPGLEWRLGEEVSSPLADFFLLHLRGPLGGRRTQGHYSRLSLATLQPQELSPLQRLCHRDRFGATPEQMVAACTLYLFEDPALGGTSFFMPRRPLAAIHADIRRWHTMDAAAFTQEIGSPPGYLTESNDHFERTGLVPAAFNRAVFYDGTQFHSSHITRPELLSADPARGRLTLNGFFICRRAAA
jgi:Family of unknown function (DUF6445)